MITEDFNLTKNTDEYFFNLIIEYRKRNEGNRPKMILLSYSNYRARVRWLFNVYGLSVMPNMSTGDAISYQGITFSWSPAIKDDQVEYVTEQF